MIFDKQWRTLRADDKRQEKARLAAYQRSVEAHDEGRVDYYLKSMREFYEACADGSAHDKEIYDYHLASATAGIRILREVYSASKRRQAKKEAERIYTTLMAEAKTRRYQRILTAA